MKSFGIVMFLSAFSISAFAGSYSMSTPSTMAYANGITMKLTCEDASKQAQQKLEGGCDQIEGKIKDVQIYLFIQNKSSTQNVGFCAAVAKGNCEATF